MQSSIELAMKNQNENQTTGPLEIIQDHDLTWVVFRNQDHQGADGNWGMTSIDLGRFNSKSHAMIFAASFDLLEACQMALRNEEKPNLADSLLVERKLRAAIAKATSHAKENSQG